MNFPLLCILKAFIPWPRLPPAAAVDGDSEAAGLLSPPAGGFVLPSGAVPPAGGLLSVSVASALPPAGAGPVDPSWPIFSTFGHTLSLLKEP